ncbi:uncharacterized protein NEMAJ01_2032 [Nematocida major]|uniref:uncharacterized protein n=1 Tax=Nematocida major TaxID=1912982 RepID=UPI002007977F|nr:uncharacterized protein NEMAJ01_2032 [Nematocida major]KAH9387136.1 hypothetical protein NEMAJ01_2032 [Nematocida major]
MCSLCRSDTTRFHSCIVSLVAHTFGLTLFNPKKARRASVSSPSFFLPSMASASYLFWPGSCARQQKSANRPVSTQLLKVSFRNSVWPLLQAYTLVYAGSMLGLTNGNVCRIFIFV